MLKWVASACAGAVAWILDVPWLVRKAALAPIATKTPVFERALSAIARRAPLRDGLVETNGGISDDLRLLLPSSKPGLLFGRSGHYQAERATLALARALAWRSGAFLDVGANDGLFTFTIAADWPRERRGTIHCFEPDTAVFARLEQNLRRNNIGARAINAAVGGENGAGIFYRNLSDDSSGSLTTYFADKHDVVAVEVPVVMLGDYLARNGIERACAKVDVEGAGLAVWEGARTALDRINWLIIEVLRPEVQANLPRRIMADSGWYAYYIRDFELVQSMEGEFEYRAPFYNWLFCATPPAALASTLAGTPFRVIEATRQRGAA